MRDAWMQVLPPGLDQLFASRPPGSWTAEQNKLFETALARFQGDGPERWHRVAEAVPGKTAWEVMAHYRDLEADVTRIEAGLMPFSCASAFALDWDRGGGGGRGPAAKAAAADQERKKGIPWTQEEHRSALSAALLCSPLLCSALPSPPLLFHVPTYINRPELMHSSVACLWLFCRLFLQGLNKYGKGDWRSISRKCVLTRTPTQVASHAQKYFLRQNSGHRDKRRPSIHDITTTNLNLPLPDARSPSSPSSIFTPLHSKPVIY